MATPSKRAVAFLRRSLKPAGLDIVIPLTLERYNAFLAQDATAASDFSQYMLPVPTIPAKSIEEEQIETPTPTSPTPTPTSPTPTPTSPTPTPTSPTPTPTSPTPAPTSPTLSPTTATTATPAVATAALSPLSSHLLVLVGNSRALWEPFLKHVKEEIDREGRVLADPIDRYVKQSVERVLATCEAEQIAAPVQTYWVADTEPGKMILAQKMAVTARAVTRCPPSQICLHPVYGPWLAFRCALVFPLEGIPEREENENEAEVEREEEGEEEEEIVSPPVPMQCDHDEELHELLAAQMAEALGQVSKDKLTEILPDAWKTWVLPRITIAPSHERMYSSEQILYHYTKDLTYLTRVVKCQQLSLCTDYLRDPPPKIAKEFRELLQKVLQGWTLPYPGGIDAIALSGGLDTSILAEASAQPWQSSEYGDGAISLDKSGAAKPILSFKHAFTVQANKQAQDAEYAKEIFGRLKDLSIQQQHILKPSLDELLQNATQVAKLLVTCDPMELRNSLVIYATLEAASRQGVRQIVTGDGADEIFCGYSFYAAMDEPKMLAYRDQIMDVMGFTAPTLARAFGMDVIAPFLDPRVLAFAKKISNRKDLVGERTPVPVHGPGVEYGKLLMRQAFPEAFSQWRWKQPIEQGAGTTALRLSHFENYCTAAEFDAAQKDAMVAHGVLVRDKEHLFFFRAFLEAFDQNLANVPKPRRLDASTKAGKTVDGYCPACGFQLSHAGQDFCVTCGFWPTCATRTNDSQGFATQALAKLESDKQRLLAKPKSWWRSRFWST